MVKQYIYKDNKVQKLIDENVIYYQPMGTKPANGDIEATKRIR